MVHVAVRLTLQPIDALRGDLLLALQEFVGLLLHLLERHLDVLRRRLHLDVGEFDAHPVGQEICRGLAEDVVAIGSDALAGEQFFHRAGKPHRGLLAARDQRHVLRRHDVDAQPVASNRSRARHRHRRVRLIQAQEAQCFLHRARRSPDLAALAVEGERERTAVTNVDGESVRDPRVLGRQHRIVGAERDALGLQHVADGGLARREHLGLAVDAQGDVVLLRRGCRSHTSDERQRRGSGGRRDQDLALLHRDSHSRM